MRWNLEPYDGPTKLVIGFDIGTTTSYSSFSVLERGRVPEILPVTRHLGQRHERGDCAVPSTIYYDDAGQVKATGAEALSTELDETWTKVERWMLHLRPKPTAAYTGEDDDPSPLPPGKSVVDVLADFIRYLFQSTKACVEEILSYDPRVSWSSVSDSIECVITHPNGWGHVQPLYRQAVERAGIVPSTPGGRPRVHSLTKGEASLHAFIAHVLDKEAAADQAAPQGIVIVHAGRVAVDLNMYSATCRPISYEEMTPAVCRPGGSVSVARQARALFEKKLKGCQDPELVDAFTRYFCRDTKCVVTNDHMPVWVRGGHFRTNIPKYKISAGKLKLTGEEATSPFNESIDATISAFEQQLKSAKTQITIAFFVGELSKVDWFYSRLQSYFTARNVRVYRPESTQIDKAVAYGAVLSCVHRALRLMTLEDAIRQQMDRCEILYAQGCIDDAVVVLSKIKIKNTAGDDAVRNDKSIIEWLTEFTQRCTSRLETTGDDAFKLEKFEDATRAYSTALSLGHSMPDALVAKWASAIFKLTHTSTETAMVAAAKFQVSRISVFRAVCNVLVRSDRIMEAVACFREMESELKEDDGEQAQWEYNFRVRCTEKLGELSCAAMDAQNYEKAVELYSTALILDPDDHVYYVLIDRSIARGLMKSWKDALKDADEAIRVDPWCHRGYEVRHAALHGMGRYTEAVEAFDAMLSKLGQSANAETRKLHSRYCDARPMIQRIVQNTVRNIPRVLIDTTTGRLCDRQQQADAFEALPIYFELVSSMTTRLNCTWIQKEVEAFYRYVMLSHKWEKGEPLLQRVHGTSVYELDASLANVKLRHFCSIVRSLNVRWAWSDTCCVDKSDNVVLQESLVAMFKWYRGSFLTIVYLRGVSSRSQKLGDLRQSVWNTRAWTYQEYVAAETVRFYTEDWQPYLGLTSSNHKKSSEIISEMEQVTGISEREVVALRPGLERVREKLYLAARRETTLVEDIAYSLFGIFNVAIPVIYGEGNRAVGRFLEHVLTGSGDVTILAWTGIASSSYNSCLPVDLTVYDSLVPPHIPQPILEAEIDNIVKALRSSLTDPSLLMTLYTKLNDLPQPFLAAARLRLPGIVFPLPKLDPAPELDSYPEPFTNETMLFAYRAMTPAFGEVVIKTSDDLSATTGGLYLVHPWIRPLLDEEFSRRHATATPLDDVTQALRLVARLRRPFGALLFESLSRVEYRRVAVDSLIVVQIREEVALIELMNGIRMIDVQ